MTLEQRIDEALDSVLKASGSALRHYTMTKTLTDMREAIRKVMSDAAADGHEATQKRTDTERLNWLEQNPEFVLRKHKKTWTCTKLTNYAFNAYPTMRQAIDAAIDGTWQD